MFPFREVESAERIDTPLTTEMLNALTLWQQMYLDTPPWADDVTVKTMNLPNMICSEIARQIMLEMKWTISGKSDETGNTEDTPRSLYLKAEFDKLMVGLRLKLEQALASGGMVIKPYVKHDGHIYFDIVVAWNLYPVAFDDDGNLTDVIFRDEYQDGKTTYTRLERHTVVEDGIHITQRAFKSTNRNSLGNEISVSAVAPWAELATDVTVAHANGQLFGWYKYHTSNNVDITGAMGISAYHKAWKIIKEADIQYSRLLWEYEGSELAIDVDMSMLKPRQGGQGMEMPKLNQRLFRGANFSGDDQYHVYNPNIRDTSYVNGLNVLLMRIEDACSIARGSISDASTEARTATELKIIRQRTYATVVDNQQALERCLRDVIKTMDMYATLYKLSPEGECDVSFTWDDSIVIDADSERDKDRQDVLDGLMQPWEYRVKWYGETETQAKAAIPEGLAAIGKLVKQADEMLEE